MKHILIYTSLILISFSSAYSQSEEVKHEVKVYKKVMGQELTVDVFYTADTKSSTGNPAIAFFHGGGWAFGSPSEFHNACIRYAKKGFVTFSFSYRFCKKEDGTVPHPEITPVECTKDARSALRWMKENAGDLKIDPERIVASGQSAGGQLALATALCDKINESTDNLDIDPTPVAFLLYSSNVNTLEAWVDRLLQDRREEIWSISPFHNLKSGMPPAIEFHGTKDTQVPYWVVEYFMQISRSMGNHFEHIKFEGKPHYLAEDNEKYATYFDEAILERSDRFLEEQGLMPE